MHNRFALAFALFVMASTLGVSGLVWAEGDPPSPPQPAVSESWCLAGGNPDRHAPGMMGGMFRNERQGQLGGTGCAVSSPMQAAMHTALAAGLGLTREDFDSRLAAGQTPAQMAAELGLSREAFFDIMDAAHAAAWQGLDEQAWPSQAGGRMGQMHARSMGQPRGPMMADCPYHAD